MFEVTQDYLLLKKKTSPITNIIVYISKNHPINKEIRLTQIILYIPRITQLIKK